MESNVWKACAGAARAVVALAVVTSHWTAAAQERTAQEETKAEPRIIERGPHHRVIERTVTETLPDGRTIQRKSSYTELAQGMHYLKDGQWVESKEEIEIFNGAAVARQGQIQVIFAANLNSPGAIDLLATDGQRFVSHVLGLIYTDYVSGRSVMIAEVKDSIGALTAPNQVTYPDAFEGDCAADVRYTYTRAGFEQDIILRTAPPSPAEWGLDPETTRLEVFTEFLAIPEARATSVTLKREEDEIARQSMKEPDLIDQRLDFGGLHIGQGQAFPLGTTPDPFDESSVPTGKSLEVIDGRTILIEKVDYPAIREQLGHLPKSASLKKDRKIGLPDPGRTMQARLLPSRPAGEPGKWTRKLQASVTAPRAGYVLDYVAHSTSSLTNYHFKSDTTYFITNSATVNFYGTTVIEGGAVIKTGAGSYIHFNGPVDCRTDTYRPAFVTAKDDDSVGEIIVGSTGTPSGYYGYQPIGLKDTSAVYNLHDLRVRHCTYAFTMYSNVRADFSNIQIGNCGRAVAWMNGGATTWRNFLFHDLATYAFQRNGSATNRAEHGTLHRVGTLISSTNSTTFLYLTNSLVIAVTNASVNFQGANNVVSASDSGFFQTVGAATYYLASGSTNRDAGTTNINVDLLKALKTRTTHPPVVLTNRITASTNLAVQAARDTNTPDLGYSYEPLDYVASQISVSNATVTLAEGVVLGVYGASSAHGLRLEDGATLNATGSPLNLCHIVRYNLVQEQANTNWSASSVGRSIVDASWGGSPRPGGQFRFTQWSAPAGGGAHFAGDYTSGPDSAYFGFTDCQFHGGSLSTLAANIAFTNCLFDRVTVTDYSAYSDYYHSTFFGGSLDLDGSFGGHCAINNLFDQTAITANYVTNDFNAYVTNATRISPTGSNDIVLTVTNISYHSGLLGRFYLPTNVTSHNPLFDAGSTNAAAVGLYHHTTTTNQVKETNSVVDFGFHYVALNGSKVSVDTDGDGLADYIEDTNGNGATDGSEASHANPVLNLVSTMTYIKRGPARRFDTNGIAYDSDSAHLGGASLTVSITSGGESGDRLAVRNRGTNAGQISVSGSLISYGGTIIATNSGGTGTTPLVVSFNANAVNASLQALVRNLTFQNLSNNPASSNRTVKFELSDGRGGTNSLTTQAIHIVCPDAIDVMVLFDVSVSMVGLYTNGVLSGYDTNRFWMAKAAASNFVGTLEFPGDRAGLISFAGGAQIRVPLTNNGPAVQASIYSQTNQNGTILDPAIHLARTNFTGSGSNTLRVMLILSDGEEAPYSNLTNTIAAAHDARDADIRIISIAFYSGWDVFTNSNDGGTNLMKAIASSERDFYLAPSFNDMQSNFNAVAHSLCRGNAFPTVAITSPTNTAGFNAPANIPITVSASDDGSVTNVAVFIGATNYANLTAPPYTVTWSNALGGSYALKAVATDDGGQSSTSSVVNITVNMQLPEIAIVDPEDSSHYAAAVSLLIRAAAVDVDGYITNVIFYTNGVHAMQLTNPPYQMPWTNLPAGSNQVHAKAWDNDGQTRTSITNLFVVDPCSQVGITNLTLSTNSVTAGSGLTATVTLTNNAPAGGQMVELSVNSPNVSIPASVLVPAGTNKVTFLIDTFNTAFGDSAAIIARTPVSGRTNTLTIAGLEFSSTQYRGVCGPMDVAILIDFSSSMGNAIVNIKNHLQDFLDNIEIASAGDYRLSLVTFDSNIYVKEPFAFTNRVSFSNSLELVNAHPDGGFTEPSDEALNMVINNLTTNGRPRQYQAFTNGFRHEAKKIIVLITDEPPAGFSGDYEVGTDDVNAHRRAVEAALKGITISAIRTWQSDYNFPVAEPIMQDYAEVTGGIYALGENGSADLHELLDAVIARCGADVGEVVTTRDDARQQSFTGISLGQDNASVAAVESSTFDLTGIEKSVTAAHLRRSGQLRLNYGSRFDLSLGVASVLDSDLQSYAPPTRSAHLTAIGAGYTTNWHLPFSFFSDINGYAGGLYPLALVDRVSSLCGNNFGVTDIPQHDSPTGKNTLTVKSLAAFEVAQGRCRDFVLTGSSAPCSGCGASWEILRYDEVIASECAPNGWSVESDHGIYGGVNVCAPLDATTGNRYEVRFLDGASPRSGYFSVLPAAAQNTAPVLKPVELSHPLCSTNTAVIVTVSLDAPAQGDGAYVAVSCTGITNARIPAYIHIAPGGSSASFTFRPAYVSSNTPFTVTANYNGERRTTGTVIIETTPVDVPQNVVAQSDSRRIAVSWDAVPQATSYNVWRGIDSFTTNAVLIQVGTMRPCFVDTNPFSGGNCYFIEAVNLNGTAMSAQTNLSYCQTFTPTAVLRPHITPHGGRFNDFAWFTVSCETTNAELWCSTNGVLPVRYGSGSFEVTNGVPFQLTASWQVIAQAFVGSSTSLVDKADFHIAQPTPLGCGSNITSMLAVTNQPSVFKGSGHYGARYSFTGRRGDVVTISVSSTEFTPDLNLTDPNGELVLQSGYPASLLNSFSPKLVHTLKTNGTYYVEVTSVYQFETGDFTLGIDCDPTAELDVFFGTTNVVSGTAYDLGLVNTGATAQLTFWLTNSGSAPLTFSSISLAPAGRFTFSPTNLTILATNSATNLAVTFHATNTGPVTGTLTLVNNDDPDDTAAGYEFEDPFVITFEAFVNPPGGRPIVYPAGLTNGQVLTTPPTLALNATAISTNGSSITQAQFRVTGPVSFMTNGSLVSGVATSGTWRVDWANAPGGSYSLKVLAMDAGGRAAFSTNVSFIVNTPPVAGDDAFDLSMNVTNELGVLANDSDPDGQAIMVTNIVTQGAKGTASVADGVIYYVPTNNAYGRDTFRYAIADSYGARATGTVAVLIRPSGQFFTTLYFNTTQITNPPSHTLLTGPTNVIGTASSDFLDYWVLDYRRRTPGVSAWTKIATATTNVTLGYLGTFDPTTLPNGQYDLRVTLTDFFGNSQDSQTLVLVTENQKIGQFTLAFTDLQIPVSGLPITLTRTYDSRNTESGDFGIGWSLDVNSVRLEKSGLMGEDWAATIGTSFNGSQAQIDETVTHLVTVTFPGGKVYRFYPVLSLNDSDTPRTGSVGLDAAWASFTYAPVPGTSGKLREINRTRFLDVSYPYIDAPITFHDSRGTPNDVSENDDAGPIYDPKEFEFETLDGRIFQFNAAGKVVKMWDRVGNSLTFNSDGVIHSSGKSVKFVRDAAGRITEIYDPNGLDTNGVPTGPAALRYTYDSAGNLVAAHQLARRDTVKYFTTGFGYTNTWYPHYLTDIDDPRGIRAIRNEYGDDGRLKSTTDANGKTIHYVHDLDGKTETIVDRLGHTNLFKYDAKGNVTESVNALNHTNRFTFDANGNQLTHTDPLGNTTTNVFDANDNLLSVTLPHKPGENPAAFTTRFTYDDHGNQTSITLPTGAVISNTVDAATGDLLAVRAGTNLITSFAYDLNGNVTAEGDKFGTNGFAYDAFGNATHMTNTLGQVIESGYDLNGNLTNLVDGGVTSRFDYDGMNREAFSDYGNGITLSNSFESHLDWTSVDAPTIGHMERRFDDQGRLAGWKTVNGATPGFAYNDNGQLEYETNSIGQVTRHFYDAAGRQTVVQNLTTGATSGSGFDAAGRRIAETNALGGFTLYTYNPDGSLAAMTNAFLTNGWVYSYETGGGCCGGSGATATVKDPLAREITSVASSYGLPLQTIRRASAGATGANAATNSITYFSGMVSPEQEAEDYPTAITDEGGRTRNLEYNPSGQLRRASDLSGSAWWTNWFGGPNNQISRMDSPTRELTSYYYDALENVSAIKFPDNNSLTNHYDSANRLNGVRLPSGTLLTNVFDSAGRLTNRQARVNGTVTESVGLNYNANDAVTIMTDNTGATTNVFDAAGRLIGIDYPTGASVRYGHDLLGRVTSITNKASGGGSAYVTRYVHDALSQVTQVIDHWNRTNRFEYDSVGRRFKRTLANGVVSEWKYNWKDQVTNLTHKTSGGTTLASMAYERLAGGEPSKITREDGSYVELKYDSALRLTNEVYFTNSVAQTTNGYAYDAAGSRIRLVQAGTTLTNNISAGYRIGPVRNASTGATNETYEYDNGGRVTNIVRSGVTLRLGFNAADQLAAVTNGATWVTYRHDGSGRRTVSTNSAGTVRRFVTAPTPGTDLESPHLVANGSGTFQQGYVFMGDEPLLRFDSAGNPVYYLEDAMGSVVGLVSNGTSIATFSYDGFGNFRSVSGTTNAPSGTGGDFRFHGAWLETDTGLLHMRAREYDQRTGRFLSRDPQPGDGRVSETLHPYVFASCNPHIYGDPSGEFTIVGLSFAGAMNNGMTTFRSAAVSYAKRRVTDKITESLGNVLLEQLKGFLGFDFSTAGDILKNVNSTFAGRGFGNAGWAALCLTLGKLEGMDDQIHQQVAVLDKGTDAGDPVSSGSHCGNIRNEPRLMGVALGRSFSVPDFIIGNSPVASAGPISYNKTMLVGDFKFTAGTMYRDYVAPGSHKEQLDAIRMYASKHTYLRTSVFVVLQNDLSQGQLNSIRNTLGRRMVSKGVIPLMVVIVGD